jgi:hypothetical protein
VRCYVSMAPVVTRTRQYYAIVHCLSWGHGVRCYVSMAPVVTRTRQYFCYSTLPILLLFLLLLLSLCSTSEVWTIRHLFYFASKKHFEIVIKFCEHLIDLLV